MPWFGDQKTGVEILHLNPLDTFYVNLWRLDNLSLGMPLFKKGGSNLTAESRPKDNNEDRKSRSKEVKSPVADTAPNSENCKQSPYTSQKLPPNEARNNHPQVKEQTKAVPSPASRERMRKQREQNVPKPTPVPPPDPTAEAQVPRFVFYCQLAHGSPTGKVEGFTNVKQLYEKIANAFKIQAEDILFCTLNTYRVDMDRLLGGQLGLDDFIFAHVKGQRKIVEVLKDQPSLGLTITDNGAGSAFIKRIKEGSIADNTPQICAGDHVEYINGQCVVGHRHFDVARMLREVDVQGKITFHLVEPKRGFVGIGPRSSSKSQGGANEDAKTEKAVGSGKATLRLKAKGPPVVENVQDTAWEQLAMKKVDNLLESFLGIRDEDLASNLVELSKNKGNPSDFAVCLDENFAEFQFPDDLIFDIWGVINDAKDGRI